MIVVSWCTFHVVIATFPRSVDPFHTNTCRSDTCAIILTRRYDRHTPPNTQIVHKHGKPTLSVPKLDKAAALNTAAHETQPTTSQRQEQATKSSPPTNQNQPRTWSTPCSSAECALRSGRRTPRLSRGRSTTTTTSSRNDRRRLRSRLAHPDKSVRWWKE